MTGLFANATFVNNSPVRLYAFAALLFTAQWHRELGLNSFGNHGYEISIKTSSLFFLKFKFQRILAEKKFVLGAGSNASKSVLSILLDEYVTVTFRETKKSSSHRPHVTSASPSIPGPKSTSQLSLSAYPQNGHVMLCVYSVLISGMVHVLLSSPMARMPSFRNGLFDRPLLAW